MDGTQSGAQAEYACDDGYELVGGSIRVCQGDQTWRDDAPGCEPVDCGALDAPDNGTLEATDGTLYRSEATYTCDEGYELFGTATRTCESNGAWSGATPGCELVDCGPPEAPENGSVSTPDGTMFEADATYECDAFYELDGVTERACQANGRWSDSAPECVEFVSPPEFVRIAAGTFTMSSPDGELGRRLDEIQHEVTLTRDFLIQETEVTQGEYEALMGTNSSEFDDCGPDCPVESVSWFDAIAYANALSAAEGLALCYDESGEVIGGTTVYDCEGYRLPTEAEWEYAARAGTTTATYAGDLTDRSCDDATLPAIAWFCGNADDRTHPVGGLEPNAWGFYDMLGNVFEWTNDWYGDYPASAITDPVGPSGGSRRGARGRSWSNDAGNARAGGRNTGDPGSRRNDIGFRLARTAP